MYAYPEPLKPPKKEEKEKVCLYEESLKEEESDFDEKIGVHPLTWVELLWIWFSKA